VRRHLDRIHHPIVGDNGHGDYRHNRFFREHLGCRQLLLHAWAIETVHPVNGVPFVVRAPVPDDSPACWIGWGSRSPPPDKGNGADAVGARPVGNHWLRASGSASCLGSRVQGLKFK
jgi:hypothetical protein